MTCQICGASLPDRAMFCGECGSSTTATPLSRKRSEPSSGDTSIIQPLPPQSAVFSIPYRMPIDRMPVEGVPDVAVELTPREDIELAMEPVAAPAPASELTPTPEPSQAPVLAREFESTQDESTQVDPVTHFVLQFSTGERVVVAGTGLLGRRPSAQPDETFDHFVQIHDVSMSVSKSHLEFGQHNGEFWINDRMSGNGTTIRRHDDSVLRCEPGRRYLVARGSRVEIGDQFFILG